MIKATSNHSCNGKEVAYKDPSVFANAMTLFVPSQPFGNVIRINIVEISTTKLAEKCCTTTQHLCILIVLQLKFDPGGANMRTEHPGH